MLKQWFLLFFKSFFATNKKLEKKPPRNKVEKSHRGAHFYPVTVPRCWDIEINLHLLGQRATNDSTYGHALLTGDTLHSKRMRASFLSNSLLSGLLRSVWLQSCHCKKLKAEQGVFFFLVKIKDFFISFQNEPHLKIGRILLSSRISTGQWKTAGVENVFSRLSWAVSTV